MVPSKNQVGKQSRERTQKWIGHHIEKVFEATGFVGPSYFQYDDETDDSVEKKEQVIDDELKACPSIHSAQLRVTLFVIPLFHKIKSKYPIVSVSSFP